MTAYSRSNLYKFAQSNLGKPGLQRQYFDLPNGDKVHAHIRGLRYLDSFLVSGSYRKKDVPIKKADVHTLRDLGDFCDSVDAYVESVVPKKMGLMDELDAMNGKFENASDFDFDGIPGK